MAQDSGIMVKRGAEQQTQTESRWENPVPRLGVIGEKWLTSHFGQILPKSSPFPTHPAVLPRGGKGSGRK